MAPHPTSPRASAAQMRAAGRPRAPQRPTRRRHKRGRHGGPRPTAPHASTAQAPAARRPASHSVPRASAPRVGGTSGPRYSMLAPPAPHIAPRASGKSAGDTSAPRYSMLASPHPTAPPRVGGTSAGGRARGSRMTRRGPFGATDDPGDPCRGQPAALTRTVSHAGATPAGPSAEYQIRAMLYEHQFFSQKRISPFCASSVT